MKAQAASKELFTSPGNVSVAIWSQKQNKKTPKSTRTKWTSFLAQIETDEDYGFEVGLKLEAVDRMNPSLICVATVTDIVGKRFLVHFDNWDDTYDYWCVTNSVRQSSLLL